MHARDIRKAQANVAGFAATDRQGRAQQRNRIAAPRRHQFPQDRFGHVRLPEYDESDKINYGRSANPAYDENYLPVLYPGSGERGIGFGENFPGDRGIMTERPYLAFSRFLRKSSAAKFIA